VDQQPNLTFKDGKIHEEFSPEGLKELAAYIRINEFSRIIGPNIENSHQDHDATSVICEKLGSDLKIEVLYVNIYQFGSGRKWLASVRSKTYPENQDHFPQLKASRRKLLLCCLNGFLIYKKEWRVWVHLGPLLLFRYVLSSKTSVQLIASKIKTSNNRWTLFTPFHGGVVYEFREKLKAFTGS